MASRQDDLTTKLGRPYTAAVLSSPTQIRQLESSVRRLMPERDVTLEPRFFLASLSQGWMPRVVVVSCGPAIVGVVYAKERRIGGFLVGVVFADARLGNMVAADSVDRDEVIVVAIQSLFALPRVRAVRLLIPPGGVEARAVAKAQSLLPFDIACHPASAQLHACLPLPADFQEFLRSLGYRTRRNFRYYSRKFEAAQHTYVEDLSPQDFQRAATDLGPKCRIPSRPGEIKRAMNTVMAADSPWMVGLKHRNGDWLSVAAGWRSSGRATMFIQLNNDREYGKASLSVVLRAHLIETLIRKGIPELVFWSGSAAPLSRYALPIPAIAVHFDTPAFGWRLFRSAIGRSVPWIPRWVAADVGWLTGSTLSSEPPALDEA